MFLGLSEFIFESDDFDGKAFYLLLFHSGLVPAILELAMYSIFLFLQSANFNLFLSL